MNPGGRGCSEPRWHHYMPPWRTDQDSISKKAKERQKRRVCEHRGEPYEGTYRDFSNAAPNQKYLGPSEARRGKKIFLPRDFGEVWSCQSLDLGIVASREYMKKQIAIVLNTQLFSVFK